MAIDLVYVYGCRAPREHSDALQLLGQAFHYREDLRRIYNDEKRAVRELIRTKDDVSHVIAHHRAERATRSRSVRKKRGHLIDHGTYWLIEDAVLRAGKDKGLDPIATQCWDETGRIGAAIMSTERFLVPATGGSTMFHHKRVTLTVPDAKRHAELSIRVGKLKENRSITWPIKIDRPLPSDAVVKQVVVQRIRSGHRFRWRALLTISVASRAEVTRRNRPAGRGDDAEVNGVVGIDIGWRREGPAGLRVATHSGEQDTDALLIPTVEAFDYADGVRGVRDRTFDAAKEYVADNVPGGEHARLWHDKERMRRLARQSDHLAPAWWDRRDRHLEDIECGVRSRAIRRRLDAFRVYADKLARTYRYVALEDMSMLDWVGEAETHAKERIRASASLSLLQKSISDRFGPERTYWLSAAYTSMTCSDCGNVNAEPIGPAAFWTCVGCTKRHHQDENAARILRLTCERLIAEEKAPAARRRKSAKGHVKRAADGIASGDERRMIVTAREPVSNAAE